MAYTNCDGLWYAESADAIAFDEEANERLLAVAALAFSGRIFHPVDTIVLADVAEIPTDRLRAINDYMKQAEQIGDRPTLMAPSHERLQAAAALNLPPTDIEPLPARGSHESRWLQSQVYERAVAGCRGKEFSGDTWMRKLTLFVRQGTLDEIEDYEAKLDKALELTRVGPTVMGRRTGLMSITTQVADEIAGHRVNVSVRSGLSPAAYALSCLQDAVLPPPEEVDRWRSAYLDGDVWERDTVGLSWIKRSGIEASAEGRRTIDVMLDLRNVHLRTIHMSRTRRKHFLEQLLLWFRGEMAEISPKHDRTPTQFLPAPKSGPM